MTTLARFR